jgi:hypothetical protein
MRLSQPPVATFVQDDATRPQVVSAQMGKYSPEKARSVGTKRSNSPPYPQLWDLPSQRADEDCQFAQPQLGNFENKPQRKNSFRLTR